MHLPKHVHVTCATPGVTQTGGVQPTCQQLIALHSITSLSCKTPMPSALAVLCSAPLAKTQPQKSVCGEQHTGAKTPLLQAIIDGGVTNDKAEQGNGECRCKVTSSMQLGLCSCCLTLSTKPLALHSTGTMCYTATHDAHSCLHPQTACQQPCAKRQQQHHAASDTKLPQQWY